IGNQQHDLFIKSSEKYKLNLVNIADEVSLKTDLIAINGEGNPQQLYFTHRKGWVLDSNDFSNKLHLMNLVEKGCKYFFINKNLQDMDFPDSFTLVFENKDFKVYKAGLKNHLL
ncbi:MAG: hypothetical protein H0X62_12005, partial [Bacteroidetes bacterium]|nr:hypothetical protein [Bacteroidota bacterium]